MDKQALSGVKVFDFGWALAGSLTGKLLGDHGAQVVKVESTVHIDFSRTNRMVSMSSPTNPDDKPWFTYYNTSKYGMGLNLKHPRAREVITRFYRWADVVSENFTPGTLNKLGLDYEYAKMIKPDIIMVGISAYGQTGPLAREFGTDAMGSSQSGHRYLTGWPDRSPVSPTTVPYGDLVLPLFTVLAIVSALDYRRRTGKGQYIDASMLDVMVQKTTPAILDWVANDRLETRSGNRVSHAAPHGAFPCKGEDRWCAIAVFTEDEWKAFCQAIGDPPWTKETRFATLQLRKENEDILENFVGQWTKQHTAEEVMHLLQENGVAAGVVQNARDLLESDPQMKERQYFVPMEHPAIGTFGHPNPPFKLLKSKAQMRTSPCLGEHTIYVCTEFLGMTDDEFIELENEGVFR